MSDTLKAPARKPTQKNDSFALEVLDLSHRFVGPSGPITILDGVNLQIEPGEFFTVLGPSGCGKTTLLNIIAGFIEADQGGVIAFGRQVEEPGPDRGVVFQSYVS